MSAKIQRITPFLWFDSEAEEAANFYTSVFDNSRIVAVTRYGKSASQPTGRPPGSVMIVAFQLDGQDFTALNGGPMFKFNESVSFVVNCASQAEVDRYWDALGAGGDPKAQQCGWLKDRYGLSWQIVPTEAISMMTDPDTAKTERVMAEVMQMKKIDLKKLRAA
jgi:predicted 3-demethylubiquinone-9 3-methyltransferase (glyoxalase superfamily)